jgi:hypothetical protein
MRAAKYHRDLKAARRMLKQFCIDHYCIVWFLWIKAAV